MNRSEMIKVLCAIREGKLKYSDLKPEGANIYLELGEVGEWEMNSKRFTKAEIDQINLQGIERDKRRSALGLPLINSRVLFLSLDRECEPIINSSS